MRLAVHDRVVLSCTLVEGPPFKKGVRQTGLPHTFLNKKDLVKKF